MKLLQAVLTLAVALALQTGLGRLWPGGYAFVDIMLVPVVWYGITGTQRSAMLVGCAAGLLQDAWFHVGAFGVNGFKKTLLGWMLGGLGSRFDLNGQGGRLIGGFGLSLLDSLLDLGLRALLDQQQAAPRPWEILVRAVVAGLLVAATFGIVERVRRKRSMRRLA